MVAHKDLEFAALVRNLIFMGGGEVSIQILESSCLCSHCRMWWRVIRKLHLFSVERGRRWVNQNLVRRFNFYHSDLFNLDSLLAAGECRMKICKCSSNICQLRLDLSTFAITGPSTLTTVAGLQTAGQLLGAGKKVSTATQCLTGIEKCGYDFQYKISEGDAFSILTL